MKFPTFLLFILSSSTLQSVINADWIRKNQRKSFFEEKEQSSLQEDGQANVRLFIIRALETGLNSKDVQVLQRHLRQVLLWNVTWQMSSSDLSLWISALVAAKGNPRNQDGINLVADLNHRVGAAALPRPYEVLALCNAGALEIKHLQKLLVYTNDRFANSTHTNRGLETEALTLKAFACALSHRNTQNLDEFVREMTEMAKRLRLALADGYFKNVCTTSVITQALTAFNVIKPSFKWSEKEALAYLRKHSTSGGLTEAYYISMALNSRRVPFLKDLHQQSYASHLILRKHMKVVLALKNEENKDADFGMTFQVNSGWNLFQIMLKAADLSNRFQFSWTTNKGTEPFIFEVDGTPNDPEKGLYWMVCSTTSERTNGFYATPSLFIPHDGENISLWYRSSDCPTL